ncbi:TPA: hypothetical protein ACRMDD_006363 [Pseudomonas aeruginosa]|nr:hypothetical protein [Pseudomonas aeruginosa]
MKTTLECTKHGLRFEQFDDWHEVKGGPVPDCYICANEKALDLRQKLAEVTRQRDILLSAIEVKLAVPVNKERSLSNE